MSLSKQHQSWHKMMASVVGYEYYQVDILAALYVASKSSYHFLNTAPTLSALTNEKHLSPTGISKGPIPQGSFRNI